MFYVKYYWILYIYCTSAGIFSMFLFIHRQCDTARDWVLSNFDSHLEKEYDFIVVGAGSSGSILASRLAENRKYKVLLIEAGGSTSAIHDIPITAPIIQKSLFDWQYKTVPQRNGCMGMVNKESCWPTGKMVGGTSRLNYMIYLRGHATDYTSWSNGKDWTFEDILYYFKRSEHHLGDFKDDTKHHGTSGSVYISELKFHTDLVDSLLGAGKELGYPTVDLNTLVSTPGMMKVQVTGFNGGRWSSEHTLRKRMSTNQNLHLVTNTVVQKVLLRQGFEAYGVAFKRNGVNGHFFAKKSVILSAGTVGTAKILMMSGIGPRDHLLQHNIEPLVDLPVGKNLQDHVTTGLDLVILNHSLPISASAVLSAPLTAYQYLVKGDGVLTHPGCEVIGLFHTDGGNSPDIQLMALPAGLSTDAGAVLRPAMCISDELWRGYFSPLVGKQVITILPTLLHPRSRGSIKLRSSNPDDPPIIDPKYLTHDEDVKVLIRGLKLIQKLVNTVSMSKLGAHLNENKMPGCEKTVFGTDPYWECYLRHLTLTAYHPVGTCRMGLDDSSVVNFDLSVRNTNKLHIADASVMPTMPSANINAAIMMIAEKGADLLKYKWHSHFHKCKRTDILLRPVTTPAQL